MESCQRMHIMQRVPVKDSILILAMTGRSGALLLAIMHPILLPSKVLTMIAVKIKKDTYRVDLSLKGSSNPDTITNLKAESPGEAYYKSQLKRGHISRNPPQHELGRVQRLSR